MKTIQEKAKAYDRALEAVKSLQEVNPSDEGIQNWVNENFPELKESEDDKIRKWIKKELESKYVVDNIVNNIMADKDFAWLEKQGQTRKITHEEICKSYGIPDIGEFSDGYHTFNGLYKQRMILFAVLVNTYKDRAWKSWKHEDGLDCFGGGWFIVGIDTPAGTYTYHYEAKDWDRFDCKILDKAKHWDGHDEFDVERLFSLVEKQGEQNTSDNGIAENIKTKIIDYFDNNLMLDGCFSIGGLRNDIVSIVNEVKQSEQKPADKVDPKFKVGDIIKPKDGGHEPWQIMQVNISDKKYRFADDYAIHFSEEDDYELIEQNPDWSEEDEKTLRTIISDGIRGVEFGMKQIAWLKSLKDKVQPQPKQGWSEEDEKMMNSFLHKAEVCNLLTNKENVWIINKLKSLKPQNTWKPSDEQLDALHDAAVYVDKSMFLYPKGILMKLYKQLKKLKEE